jgi:DNA-binding transcriptional ArsR family regulator
MTNDKFEPQKSLILLDDNQIKGYIHPTRIFLLQLLAKEKRTISSVAKELYVHPANITHHFKLLEKIGLIRLVEKRDTGKNLEKYYRAIAYAFEVNPGDKKTANKKALALSILKNDLSVAINTVKEDDGKRMIALLATARISSDHVNEFIVKLENLIEDFKACDSKAGSVYNINLSLYSNDIDYHEQKNIKLT